MKSFFVQLIIIASIIFSLVVLINFVPNPRNLFAENRDAQRINDLSNLTVAIESYIADYGKTPDLPGVIRHSNQSLDNKTSFDNAVGSGWIRANLAPYILKLKVDPVNLGNLVYRYISDGSRFKLDTVLESQTHLMDNSVDGGIDDSRFEAGTGKDLDMDRQ